MAIPLHAIMAFFKDDIKSISSGEKHYMSGQVEECYYFEGVLSGAVRAARKDRVYRVSVSTSQNREIVSSLCECSRGEHKCSHAAALVIFALHNISHTECVWRRPEAATHLTAQELFPSPKPYNALSRQPTQEDREWLRERLAGKGTGLGWLLSPEPEPTPQPPVLSLSVGNIVQQQKEVNSILLGEKHASL